ncbi:MAG: type II secretion system protein [Tepidisphaeraceae bacterium]
MYRIRKSAKGFTLVEILIVVIILGILAAIVIPQFTNASQDARKNSLVSQLQTVRSQIELYKLQHLDQLPPALVTGGAAPACWVDMTAKTNADHTTTGTPQFGPYLQASPVNPLNNSADVGIVTGTTDYGSGGVANTSGSVGFVLNTTTGKIWATSTLFGFIYNEGDPSDTQNDQ